MLPRGEGCSRSARLYAEGLLPRYVDIQRSLESRILSGELQPGDRIPSELELVAQHGVSRMTVNKALSSLVTAGLIVRRRRSGSFVASPKSQETVLEIHDIKVEVLATGHRYRHEVIERQVRRATTDERTRLSLNAGGKVVALKVRHFADERPFVVEERIISLVAVPDALTTRFEEIPPGTWLLERTPWTEAEHVIRAICAPAEVASLLHLKKNAACLVIDRITWRSGTPVTSVQLIYPGDRHELAARFNPTTAKSTRTPPERKPGSMSQRARDSTRFHLPS